MPCWCPRLVSAVTALLLILGSGVRLLAADDARPADEAHPVVPAFARFFTDADSQAVRGGQLLLGELNCTSCHAADESLAGYVLPRQAPILDHVGRRVRVDYLRAFIAHPQQTKPGTPMPALFAGTSPALVKQQVEALVHFLASSGTVAHERANPQAVKRGRTLFHRVGCVACHAPRTGDVQPLPPHSVPLGDLAAKYTIPSLAAFLKNPHQVRPSGRMPSLNLVGDEPKDVASFLLQGADVPAIKPNMRFAAYEGSWSTLPDFDTIKPYKTGLAAAFDLSVAGRTGNFGMRFDGFLHLERNGNYRFHLGSDDASRLLIDGEPVVNNDGVHPHTVRNGRAALTAGVHAVRVEYAQVGGEWTLELQVEGPGTPRQSAYGLISPDKNTPPATARSTGSGPVKFVPSAELARQGRQLFAELGCAACHQKQEGDRPIASTLKAPALDQLQQPGGCLAAELQSGLPDFNLSGRQRQSLAAALAAPPAQPIADEDRIAHTLAAFNCYACHERNDVGGVPRAREALFLGTIPEMGDEGRIPPHLDGVGDKLRLDWLQHVMASGADDRPYMHTRMPKFGKANVGFLPELFARRDAKTEVDLPEPKLPLLRTKAAGRFIIGEKALACIKCHNFGKHKATGIQSIDLQTMTRRLRKDWFHRYMLQPSLYRPGTRMPTGFPGGRSVIRDVLDGKPHQQLLAIWEFLSDGTKAPVPLGLLKQAIVLKPETEPIVYRNFLEGLSPWGIAVGYPERAHLAFDAEDLSLALLWHGAFIDASQHWTGRGAGTQRPLGNHVVSLVRGVPFALLDSAETAWPGESARQRGFAFHGYRLDKQRRPVFRYGNETIEVEDHPQPVPGRPDPGFKRTLTVTADSAADHLWYRAAAGKTIEKLDDGWFLVNNVVRVRVAAGDSEPVLRKSNNGWELIVPLEFRGKPVSIVQDYAW